MYTKRCRKLKKGRATWLPDVQVSTQNAGKRCVQPNFTRQGTMAKISEKHVNQFQAVSEYCPKICVSKIGVNSGCRGQAAQQELQNRHVFSLFGK